MATVAQKIEAIRTAIASGVQTVSYDGKATTFRSLAEMKQVLRDLEAEEVGSPPSRTTYASYLGD